MNIKQTNAQILVNRKELAALYNMATFYKGARKQSRIYEDLPGEYRFHNKLKTLKKDIARFVVLQKALKADLAKELSFQRAVRRLKMFKSEISYYE